ncbi:hypothetical protein BKA69DRAFT_1151946 [Paraphysoderma sedebokerense]|nr:hypothetical protein BKA69DRAFT_1151946 [Paraphysoderma sedebokerense]
MISSPCYQKLRSESKTTEVSSTNDTLAASQLTEADVIFTSGFTQVPGRENRIVAQYASSDPGVINRAEWMEFVGQFYNREESAEAIVRDIDGRYKCVKEAAVAKGAGAGNPSIAWISYTLYEGAKSWSVSTAKFKQSYVEDAGATFFKASKSLFTDLNEFKAAIKDVDVVIDESFVSTDTPEGFAKEFGVDDSFKFVKNKQVYRVDKQQNPTGLFG